MEVKLFKIVKRDEASKLIFFLTPILAIILTLIFGALIFYFLGFKPLEALKFFFIVPINNVYGFSELFVKATPLCLIAIGLSFCFKSNNWNIGAEGQLIFGGIVSGGVAFRRSSLNPYTLLIGTIKKNFNASNGLKPSK